MKNNKTSKDYIDNMLKEAFRNTSLYPTQQIIHIRTSSQGVKFTQKAIADYYANITSPKTKSEE